MREARGTPVRLPLPRRQPWKVAREVVSLDHLSGGRVVLGPGIGADRWGREFSAFGQWDDDRLHAEMLDEGLDILTGLWSGKPFSYEGKHYKLSDVMTLASYEDAGVTWWLQPLEDDMGPREQLWALVETGPPR